MLHYSFLEFIFSLWILQDTS